MAIDSSFSPQAMFASVANAEAGTSLRKKRPVELGPLVTKIADEFVDNAISPTVFVGGVRAIEALIVILTGYACYFAYLHGFTGNVWIYNGAITLGTVFSLFTFHAAQIYSTTAFRSYVRTLPRFLLAWLLVFALLAGFAFALKIGDTYSRMWTGLWFFSGFVAIAVFRIGLAVAVRQSSIGTRLHRRAVVVGGGSTGADLIRSIESDPEADIEICGVFDDRNDDRVPSQIAGHPKLGTVDELVEFGRLTRIDMLLVTLPIRAETRLLQLLRKLWVLPVDIRLAAHANELRFRPRSYSFVGQVPTLAVFDKPIADWDYVLKSVFDRITSALLILLLAPVMALVALAVRLESRGPALFKQKRYGFNNELIEVYKFRSMYTDRCDANAVKLVTKDDPRVTRVGRFIRKTSLDELPQLFNVLKGQLSLVGPRPHALQAKAEDKLYDDVVDGYFARHRVKPGITGWAQINGWRGETDTREKLERRVEHDLHYIENWSIWFDIYILVMTPIALADSRSAY
ncbi:MAG: undecaprenyl-phosphate glucose phosphotransferase [Pseudomonadota bacterium]